MPACAHKRSSSPAKAQNNSESYEPACRFCLRRSLKGSLVRISENCVLKEPIEDLFPLAVTVDKEMADWICEWCKQSFLMYRELLVRTAQLREEADPTYRPSKGYSEEHKQNLALAREKYPQCFKNEPKIEYGAVQENNSPQLPPNNALNSTTDNTTNHPPSEAARVPLKRKINAGTNTVESSFQVVNENAEDLKKQFILCPSFKGGKCPHEEDNSISGIKTRDFNKLVESVLSSTSLWKPPPDEPSSPKHMPVEPLPDPDPAAVPSHPCKHCPRMFSNVQLLTWHNRVHLSRASITCRHCAVVMPKVSSLLYHVIREHGALKRAKCFLCHEKFIGYSAAQLNEHEQDHIRVRMKYSCSFCPLIFSSHAKLRTHRQKAHLDWSKRCRTAASIRLTNRDSEEF